MSNRIRKIGLLFVFLFIFGLLFADLVNILTSKEEQETIAIKAASNEITVVVPMTTDEIELAKAAMIVYDGLTMEELAQKLDRSLNSTLSGKGNLIASHCMELGLDPYIAVAIMLQETGCKWTCSSLVVNCNNVGGQKGTGCGSYKSYPTLDDGIIGFLDNLYYNYYSIGLTTPELMNPKYAESTSWASNVNRYIDIIKAS